MNFGLLGAHLKSLLATRTVVFVGYSLRDDDFLQVYNALRKLLADFHRQAYFVSPQIGAAEKERLQELKLHLIETDGEFFIKQLKTHARSRRCICDDEMYIDAAGLRGKVFSSNKWLCANFDQFDFPQTIIACWYQDGMAHALDRLLRLRKTGEYSDLHRLIETVRNYLYFSKRFRQDGNFGDAAYCEGYANALMYCSLERLERAKIKVPLFFHFDVLQTSSRSLYQRNMRKLPKLHRSAHKFMLRFISGLNKEERLITHHRPQLSLGRYIDELSARQVRQTQ